MKTDISTFWRRRIKVIAAVLMTASCSTVAAQKCTFRANTPDQLIVVKRDTLWNISSKFLERPDCWAELWVMNKEEIPNPHMIHPGQIVYFDRTNRRLSLNRPGSDGLSGPDFYRLHPPLNPIPDALNIPGPHTPDSTILYRARIQPQLERLPDAPNRPVLLAQESTTFRFSIGPSTSSFFIVGVPSKQILNSNKNLKLSVSLACDFCEPMAGATRQLIYQADKKNSNEVRFQFTPKLRNSSERGEAVEQMQLSITDDATGREYDRFAVFVTVASAGTPLTELRNEVQAEKKIEPVESDDWNSDVVLYVNEENSKNITIAVQPVTATMRALLDPLAVGEDGMRKTFQSGVDDSALLEAMTNTDFGAMSAVGLQAQNREMLKKLSASGANVVVASENQVSLQLSTIESTNVSKLIASTGKSLYGNLFYANNSPDLLTLIQRIETAASKAPLNKPLRLVIVTNRLSLPWQYLHPSGPGVDPNSFWGLRFSLTIRRGNTQATHKAGTTNAEGPKKIVFAQYGGGGDPSIPLAKVQQTKLLSMPMADGDLLRVGRGKDLLEKLKTERQYITGIVTFLHGSVGDAGFPPHLEFNTGDLVTSRNLEDLRSDLSGEERLKRYFSRGPLVILNACETGPAKNLPHVKLENTLFKLGAQGVVVTEVSVWINLGHSVATKLIERLNKGEPVSDALTAVRRDLYREKKNPLGLLYAYYGNPAATFGTPSAPPPSVR